VAAWGKLPYLSNAKQPRLAHTVDTAGKTSYNPLKKWYSQHTVVFVIKEEE